MRFKDSVPGRIKESHSVLVECTVDGVEDREFSESLDSEQQHGTDDHEPEQLEPGLAKASYAAEKVI